jgi:hypothetical protein
MIAEHSAALSVFPAGAAGGAEANGRVEHSARRGRARRMRRRD